MDKQQTSDAAVITRQGNPGSVHRLLAGTMVATDIDASRDFYENFLGLECVRYAPDRLLVRDRYARQAMETGDDDFFVIDVQQVPEITHPQRMLHHWGFDVATHGDVDRIHAHAKERKAELGLKMLGMITDLHESHSFFLADRDSNWWEIEYRLDGMLNGDYFVRGDVAPDFHQDPVGPEQHRSYVDPAVGGNDGAVLGNARLTHGTMELTDRARTRRFLEEVANLRAVYHRHPATLIAGRGDFAVFALPPPKVKPQGEQNRWIISAEDASGVAAVRDRALAAQAEMAFLKVGELIEQDGAVSMTIQDADSNWWEFTSRSADHYRAIFAAGDVV